MKLTTKTLLLLAIITLITISFSVYVRHARVLPELIELESQSDRKDVGRVEVGFDMVRNILNILAYDYGVWNNTVRFMAEGNINYVQDNYRFDTFVSNDFNIALLVNNDKEILLARHADLDEEVFLPESAFDYKQLFPYLADNREARPGAPITSSGIVQTTNGPMLYASISVLNSYSNSAQKSPGTLLFGRFIDQSLASEIKDTLNMSFTIKPVDPEQVTAIKAIDIADIYRNKDNTIDWYLFDINENPILKLNILLDERAFQDQLFPASTIVTISTLLSCWLIIMFILSKTLIRPILQIGQHLVHIRQTEDYSLRLCYDRKDELGGLGNECDKLIGFIEEQQKQLEKQAEELRRLSYEDGLTHIANRRRFDQLLHDYWAISERDQKPISLIMCDIDFFKQYNDNYGHQAGDEVLKTIADVLRATTCRDSDLAARYGGEEFALVLPNTNQEGAITVAKRLHELVEQANLRHEYSPTSDRITLSIGLATTIGSTEEKISTFIHNADDALYEAKDQGRNRSVSSTA